MTLQTMRFDVVDYIIFALLLIFSSAIGIFHGFIDKRRKKNKFNGKNAIEQPKSSTKEYLLANKSMGVNLMKFFIFLID